MTFLPSIYSPLGWWIVALCGQRPGWASAPVLLVQPCSASPRVPHTHLPSWPVVACVAGSPVRGRWGRLSRWCVAGAGDGSGHPGGPCAAGEMPRPCSSAMKSKRKLTSCPSQRGPPRGDCCSPSSTCPSSCAEGLGACPRCRPVALGAPDALPGLPGPSAGGPGCGGARGRRVGGSLSYEPHLAAAGQEQQKWASYPVSMPVPKGLAQREDQSCSGDNVKQF